MYFFKTPMRRHVLFVMHSMNYAAGAEEHKSFEEGMRHDMENADGECADPASHNMKPSCDNG